MNLRWICLSALLIFIFYSSNIVSYSIAFEIYSDPEKSRKASLDIAGKWTSLTTHAPDDPILYPERDNWTEFFRLRLGLNVQQNQWLNSEFAYEQRARWMSKTNAGGAGGSFLPSVERAFYRIRQLDWEISDSESFIYRQEIDRALVAMHPEWGQVIIGRQAIGLGRGVIFSAVDIFAPFSPLEVDREWRRGVDAVRIEKQISNTSSAELIGAFGQTWEQSVLLARARGYIGDIDGEVMFGKRAEDTMLGGTMSAIVGEAEVHAELAFFKIPERQPDGGIFHNDREVGKLVVGGSYTFNIGNGLTMVNEYHYSGFGLKDIEDAAMQLNRSEFLERILRGDTQILGRQALAHQLNYPFTTVLNNSLLILHSPQDGSGVASPSLTWDFSQSASVIGSIFVPWGHEPSGGRIKSEYGGTPLTLFLQLRCYF